ncbi:hypothetical protein CDL12_26889 [Handroanthus impetiginosus]|uniref:Uncharacterized protein n=1 Tax=Handroanthus impetiginosus TaxID=429701 RepID=A0A2G9G5M5_9LAMI|nr:hypothetical protein CDL12_26889 [Handroanthus impetiginosus]
MVNEEDDDKGSRDNPWPRANREKEEEMRLWGILIFGLIGATVTTYAVSFLCSFNFVSFFVVSMFCVLVKLFLPSLNFK